MLFFCIWIVVIASAVIMLSWWSKEERKKSEDRWFACFGCFIPCVHVSVLLVGMYVFFSWHHTHMCNGAMHSTKYFWDGRVTSRPGIILWLSSSPPPTPPLKYPRMLESPSDLGLTWDYSPPAPQWQIIPYRRSNTSSPRNVLWPPSPHHLCVRVSQNTRVTPVIYSVGSHCYLSLEWLGSYFSFINAMRFWKLFLL